SWFPRRGTDAGVRQPAQVLPGQTGPAWAEPEGTPGRDVRVLRSERGRKDHGDAHRLGTPVPGPRAGPLAGKTRRQLRPAPLRLHPRGTGPVPAYAPPGPAHAL